MISKCEDCDYTVSIADLMVYLSELVADDKYFALKIWIQSFEVPLTFESDDCDFMFLQESIKISYDGTTEYVLYDCITHLKVEVL